MDVVNCKHITHVNTRNKDKSIEGVDANFATHHSNKQKSQFNQSERPLFSKGEMLALPIVIDLSEGVGR